MQQPPQQLLQSATKPPMKQIIVPLQQKTQQIKEVAVSSPKIMEIQPQQIKPPQPLQQPTAVSAPVAVFIPPVYNQNEEPPLVLSNPDILAFFKNTMLDPNKFITRAILQYQNEQYLSKESNQIQIHEKQLDPVFIECSNFLIQKNSIIKNLRELQNAINKINFEETEKLYSLHHPNTALMNANTFIEKNNTIIYNCEICKNFAVCSKKSLALHQRKCSKKIQKNADTLTLDEDEEDDDSEMS